MGWWSAYFLIKIMLHVMGYLDFHPWVNLAFAIFTALRPRNTRQRLTKNLLAVPIGIALLYYDSWLPPLAQAAERIQNLSAFSSDYLWELVGRLISWRLLLELAATLALYVLARRKLRMSTFAFLGIIGVMIAPRIPAWPAPAGPGQAATNSGPVAVATGAFNLGRGALDARLTQFYSEQKKIRIRFAQARAEGAPFDIIILHVCSLSWDDMRVLHLAPDTLLEHFDLVFTHFNSGASYSGPAAIRLLRGTCGQTPESQLYDPADPGCFVMDGLQNLGFEPHWLMNHDGHFGNFFRDVHDRGGLSAPLEDNSGATPAQQAFDGSPVYSDYSTLSRWWTRRQASRTPRVALYYNTISLHDGNRMLGTGHPDSSYAARFRLLSGDITRFLEELRTSGRHVIVMLVAEHGAALDGGHGRIQGLREIPTAAIATVPVAIALVNTVRPAQLAQEKINSPASYPALSELLSRLVASDPFDKSVESLDTLTEALPQTDFVAENNGTTVVQVGTQYVMRSPDGAWSRLERADSGM
jgi:cellulose synthase operon protein YhjU